MPEIFLVTTTKGPWRSVNSNLQRQVEHSSNCWYLSTKQHDVMSLTTAVLIPMAVRTPYFMYWSWSQWARGLRRRSTAARLLRMWVRIPPGAWMFICCECCVLSGRGLGDAQITRAEESYRLWCVVVCDLETSRMRKPWPALGRRAPRGWGNITYYTLNERKISHKWKKHPVTQSAKDRDFTVTMWFLVIMKGQNNHIFVQRCHHQPFLTQG